MRTASRRAPRARATAIVATVLTSLVVPVSVASADDDLVTAGRAVTAEPAQDDGSSPGSDDGSTAHEPDRGRARLLVVIAVVIGGVVGGVLGVRAVRNRGEVPVDGENEGPPG